MKEKGNLDHHKSIMPTEGGLKVTTVTGGFYLKHIKLRKYFIGIFPHFGSTNIM